LGYLDYIVSFHQFNELPFRLVIITCIYAPYTLAFLDDVPKSLDVLDTVINFIFLFDILVNMISAY
jgi:hypothetical protein